MPLRGRAALVTGAGHRVGRAIALALAARGVRLAVHYHRSGVPAEETAALARQAGTDASIVQADLTRPDAPARLVDEAAAALGGLDILVNSAAVMERTPIGEVTPAQWDAMFALNLRAPFFASQAAARHMTRGGAIVNIADLAAFETWPAYVPHGISKAGVVQMTRALARALAPAVRVNAVAPGAVLWPEAGKEYADQQALVGRSALKRAGTPEEVATAVLFLVRDAKFTTGEILRVDGGRMLGA